MFDVGCSSSIRNANIEHRTFNIERRGRGRRFGDASSAVAFGMGGEVPGEGEEQDGDEAAGDAGVEGVGPAVMFDDVADAETGGDFGEVAEDAGEADGGGGGAFGGGVDGEDGDEHLGNVDEETHAQEIGGVKFWGGAGGFPEEEECGAQQQSGEEAGATGAATEEAVGGVAAEKSAQESRA